MRLVQFGAGNIGRSFVGQIFSMAHWEVIFIDIDGKIIDELNRKGQYIVEVKDREPKTIVVKHVRGIPALDMEQVSDEVAGADLVSTAVGKKALPHIMKPIAIGLIKRQKSLPGKPIDVIICENMKNAAAFFKSSLKKELPDDFPLEDCAGFIETSIGKMVPIMSEKEKIVDPLLVQAEAYNTLIVDKVGFKGPIPEVPELDPKDNIKAYVDRKLFIHNLGHAVLSYTSFVFKSGYTYIWEAAFDKVLAEVTKQAMWESGRAVIAEYPADFNDQNINDHINDLLMRFGNRALGDSIYRAGRDLYRKLWTDDRLIGAVKLCLKHGIIPEKISLGVASAMFFRAKDENGQMYENDRLFHEKEISKGINHVLKNICNLKNAEVCSLIERYYVMLNRGERDIGVFF